MKIHFGAFNCPVEGWINTDVTPHLYLARLPLLPWLLKRSGKISAERYKDYESGAFRRLKYLNVTKTWPFPSESADAIFSSHVVEHLPLHGAVACMKSAYRVLRKGGVLRIVVPDLDKLVADYTAARAYQWAQNFFESDITSEKNMHHFMYNRESMFKLMRDAGFEKVTACSFQVGACPDIRVLDNRPDSLFVEAFK